MNRSIMCACAGLFALIVGGCQSAQKAEPQAPVAPLLTVSLPPHLSVHIKFDEAPSRGAILAGKTLVGTVTEDKVVGGVLVVPVGTKLYCRATITTNDANNRDSVSITADRIILNQTKYRCSAVSEPLPIAKNAQSPLSVKQRYTLTIAGQPDDSVAATPPSRIARPARPKSAPVVTQIPATPPPPAPMPRPEPVRPEVITAAPVVTAPAAPKPAPVLSTPLPVAKPATPASPMRTLAEKLVREGHVHLSGDVQCFIYDAAGTRHDAFEVDDADTLLKIAACDSIFVFVHGFQAKPFGGRPSPIEAEQTWHSHLALLEGGGKPVAVCIVRTDMLQGFGDQQPDLGNLIFSLRWLTDQPAFFRADRRITMVAHSAGGNYLKHALLLFQRSNQASGVEPGGAGRTEMRVLFLATPHYGTDVAVVTAIGSELFEMMVSWFEKPKSTYTTYEQYDARRSRERTTAELKHLAESKGALQLVPGSSDLMTLNARFRQNVGGNYLILNIASVDDKIVPAKLSVMGWTAPGVVDLQISNLGHFGFLDPTDEPTGYISLRRMLRDFYKLSDDRLYEAENDIFNRSLTGKSPPPLPDPRPYAGSNPPKFALAAKPRSSTSLALERYLRTRLVGPATDDQMAEIADVMASRFEAAQLPAKDYQICFSGTGNERKLLLYRIPEIESGDLASPQAKAIATHLEAELRECLPPGVNIYWPFGNQDPPKTAIEAPASPLKPIAANGYRGPGALLSQELKGMESTIYDLSTYVKYRRDMSPLAYWNMVNSLPREVQCIKAVYRSPTIADTTRTVYFWYKQAPPEFTEMKKTLPSYHPALLIRDACDNAPDRLP